MEQKTCVKCGSTKILKSKKYPDIPRCITHQDYIHRRKCACGKEEWVAHSQLGKSCRKCADRVRHTNKVEIATERLKARFLKFLSKARIRRELERRFTDPDSLLAETYPGYSLFQQRNQYNEPIWILLPVINKKVEVKPKDWSFHIGVDQEGVLDPYLMVQLPDAFVDGRIRIVPIFDAHIGHIAHRDKKFLSYIRWIEENPNIYAILGGDLMENALDDGRGMTYENDLNPQSQLDVTEKLLSRIAHKILLAIPGNHEWRTYKKAGIDPMRFLCSRLEIPYFDGPVFLSLLAAGYKWMFYVTHGRTSARTKGGILNAAQYPKRYTGMIHFLVSGHVHDPLVNPETIIVEDPVNCRLQMLTQWTVIAQSFLGWKRSYAYRDGYAPPGMGGVTMEVQDNGEYKAALR